MPVISITMGESTKEQKKALISGLTETAVEITGIPQQAFTVLINELSYDSIGVGGKTVTEIRKSNS